LNCLKASLLSFPYPSALLAMEKFSQRQLRISKGKSQPRFITMQGVKISMVSPEFQKKEEDYGMESLLERD
jgi:hypothetical protein